MGTRKPGPDDAPSRRRAAFHVAAVAGLVVVTAALYAPGLGYPLVLDDPAMIAQNKHIRSTANIPTFFDPGYWTEHRTGRSYRPMVETVTALNWAAAGGRTSGLRVLNVALLAAVAALVYWLVWRLARSRSAALVAGLVFAVHPMHLETFTLVKNRSELLAGLFGLLALLSYLRAVRGGDRWWAWWIGSIAATAAALLSKEVALAIPLVLTAAALTLVPSALSSRGQDDAASPATAQRSRRRALAMTVPMWLLAIGLVAVVFTAMPEKYAHPRIRQWQRLLEFAALGPAERTLVSVKTTGVYLGLLAWPFTTCADRAFEIPRSLGRTDVLASIGAIVVVLGLVVWAFRRRPLVAFGLIWLAAAIGPVANLVPVASRPIAEQRLFGATIPFALLMGLAFARLGALWFADGGSRSSPEARAPRDPVIGAAVTTVLAVLVVLLGGTTVTGRLVWRTEFGLWQRTAEQSPTVRRALLNYGHELRNRADDQRNPQERTRHLEASVAHLERAVRLDDLVPKGVASLAVSLERRGQTERATRLFRLSLSWDPASAMTHGGFGMLLIREGRLDAGIYELREAVRLEPDSVVGHFTLAQVLAQERRLSEAVPHFLRASELAPDDPGLRLRLASALHRAGRLQEALAECQAIMEKWPGQEPARRAAGLAQMIQRDMRP